MIPTALDLALRERFAPPEWALFFEVRNATGYVRDARSADAIAMSLWPSRGLEFHGFEVKRSRADWLREKKDPAKAEEISKYCDRWWLVVDDPTIVKDGELPASWGLLALRGKSLRCEREAPVLTATPFDRPFVAALLRSAQKARPEDAVLRAAVDGVRTEMLEQHRQELEAMVGSRREELAKAEKVIRDFEEASGLNLRWPHQGNGVWADPKKLGEAVRFVLDGGVEKLHRELADLAEKADRIQLSARAILESRLGGGQSG